MLKINNLTVKVKDKTILENFNLEIEDGTIHALMGQNGAGKSTIAKVLMRDTNYEVVKGSITYNDIDILKKDTTSVARLGMFMVSQNPMEIEGITNAELLRTAYHECGKQEINVLEFNKKLTNLCHKLNIPSSFIHRDINFNMSGGEKKKNELLHLWMLEPNFIILDEIDSGLDVDALKMVATSIKEYYIEFKPSILIITHQKALLDILNPKYVHILSDKHIKKSGNNSLLDQVFNEGFGSF